MKTPKNLLKFNASVAASDAASMTASMTASRAVQKDFTEQQTKSGALALFTHLLFLAMGISQNAKAFENQPSYNQGQFEIQSSTTYFKTDGNYKSGGSKDSLPSGFSYQLIDSNVRSRMVFMEDWGLFGSLNVANSESKDNIKTLTNSTVNWLSLGTDYRWMNGDFVLISDFEVIVPFEKVTSDMNASLNWDGATHVRPRLLAQYNFGILHPYAYLGIEWRDKGLSTSGLYGGGVSFELGHFELGGELNGYGSIKDDQYTNEVFQREGVINNYNANSKKFYSINPSSLDSDFYARWKIGKNWILQAAGGLTLTGSESASGYHATGVVKFLFGGENGNGHHRNSNSGYSHDDNTYGEAPNAGSQNSSGATSLSPTKPQAKPAPSPMAGPAASSHTKPGPAPAAKPAPHQEFEEDTEDGVDQNYFKPAPPVDTSIKEPVQNPAASTSSSEAASSANEDYKIKLKSAKKAKKK